MSSSWICCQLGAREHYAIPRALHRSGQLTQLITDAWVPPRSPLNHLPQSLLRPLRDRYHPDLSNASVQAFTPSLIQFEATQKLKKTADWDRMIARNHWFQARTIQHLEASQCIPDSPTLFTYSYAALELLKYAKSKGWRTVLGQIDPGIVEEKIVIAEHAKYPDLAPHWQPVPPSYWNNWQQECELADRILVNSRWSADLLEKAGVDPEKIKIVPLVYQPSAPLFNRTYPAEFSRSRPMRVLFLGQVNLRKGMAAVLEAVRQLESLPIEFWFVGSQQITIPADLADHPQVRWVGTVPRSQTQPYYQQADVFLFPTLSDGFGLTQLEAQSWRLPLITSRFCGAVVRDQVNGVILPEVTGEAIAAVLQGFVTVPQRLADLSQGSGQLHQFSIEHLSDQLRAIQLDLSS
jgi:glycosyltransferase involved in cell wall biosynthesis